MLSSAELVSRKQMKERHQMHSDIFKQKKSINFFASTISSFYKFTFIISRQF